MKKCGVISLTTILVLFTTACLADQSTVQDLFARVKACADDELLNVPAIQVDQGGETQIGYRVLAYESEVIGMKPLQTLAFLIPTIIEDASKLKNPTQPALCQIRIGDDFVGGDSSDNGRQAAGVADWISLSCHGQLTEEGEKVLYRNEWMTMQSRFDDLLDRALSATQQLDGCA